LPPAEREAVFETLDEEVAAEALEEVDRKLQVAIVESLDSDRAADIVEEMDPDAAADLLGDLPEGTSEQILKEMQPEEREEVSQLLEYGQKTAAGRMTTEYVTAPVEGTVSDAIQAVRGFEGGWESLAAVYLTTPGHALSGVVPLARLLTSPHDAPLRTLVEDEVISCPSDAPDKQVAELFDKYNLLALPVVDEHGRLTGVITADDVIAVLRRE
ncbi:MAG TPA: CBS domain-containing protein, partial [Gemmatimonadaceae bacterium]|nr:CBS domain-containing protein [Gemmatimonadaceae bacterium]